MKIFSQYKGLRRENYILFIGRIVTNLGAMVWPVLTLILSQKLGMNAKNVALVSIGSEILLLPIGLLGGKLADKYNKKRIIVVCDLISIVFYFICAAIPLSFVSVALMVVGAGCQSMEYPAYNALIADLTCTADRERAYSLQYLGANIGLVASPTIAGLLFADYLWLSFLLSGAAIGISTLLIALRVRNIEPVREESSVSAYQQSRGGESLLTILGKNPVIVLYVVMMGLYYAAYQMYGYLMPLDMGNMHGEDGAVIYGSVSSLNCVIVVLFTPLMTRLFKRVSQTWKAQLGQSLLLVGYGVFLIFLGKIPAYYAAISLFTFGEILTTLTEGPYLTNRVPESHRGRINGFSTVVQSVACCGAMYGIGALYDAKGAVSSWASVLSILAAAIVLGVLLIVFDKKRYGALYGTETGKAQENEKN